MLRLGARFQLLYVLRFYTGKQFVAENTRNMANNEANRMVWVDLEMTGLDVNNDRILEMACIITDSHLNIVEKGPNIVIHESDEVLNNMNEWCIEHHGKSGLTEEVRQSKILLNEAENQMLSFVSKHVPKGTCPLAGNSVHADKTFLTKYMPHFTAHLHYRIIDVSTIKELCRRWYPNIYSQAPKKGMSHRALDDIIESIKELEFYKNKLFI